MQTASPWLLVVPSGMRDMLLWIGSRYGSVPIFVTETGTILYFWLHQAFFYRNV